MEPVVQRRTFRLAPWVTWALALGSWLLLLDILTLAAHIRLGLGHWPKPMLEGYDTFFARWHHNSVILLGLVSVYLAAPFWLLCLCVRELRISKRVHVLQALVFLLGWGAVLGFCAWDPEKFVTWYLD